MEKKRLTAMKTRIEGITKGKYYPAEGFNPSHVLSSGLRMSRVRIMGTVVDKFMAESGKFASLTLDDGTDTIRAKIFNAVSMFDGVREGDVVDVTGKIKEFQGELYVQPEIVVSIEEPNMELLRELEIRKIKNEIQKRKDIITECQKQTSDLEELKRMMKERFGIEPEETESLIEMPEEKGNGKEKILTLITELDRGDGCNYSELIEASGMDENAVDSIVNNLLESGECFEPKPGKIKKL
jgi:RPA family protein